ncbi:MAG: Uma2 family endonuclease [Gemmatimonadales bacterium]|nr:Uma2 family endonuclease [Gemmatimonadales bacterium]
MDVETERWTRARLLALPDDGCRHELIDGEHVVTPSPAGPHQEVLGVLVELLRPYCRLHGIGRCLFAPADLAFGEDEMLQPDIFVVPGGDRPVRAWSDVTRLLLVVEIASPSSTRTDRGLKRRRYQRARVSEYWVVDPGARTMERWTPDDAEPHIEAERLAWHPEGAREPLILHLPALFREALDG